MLSNNIFALRSLLGIYLFTLSFSYTSGGIDRVRVHPKFLHSNATSHKWALGGIYDAFFFILFIFHS